MDWNTGLEYWTQYYTAHAHSGNVKHVPLSMHDSRCLVVSFKSDSIVIMEDHSSPPRKGDCASVPILIADSPEDSPNDLLGAVQRSLFKTVSDRGRKDSFRLVNRESNFFGF